MDFRSLLDQLPKLISCQNCGNRFCAGGPSSAPRLPRVSPCGHVLCEQCILILHLKNAPLPMSPCPLCGTHILHCQWVVCLLLGGIMDAASEAINLLTEAQKDRELLSNTKADLARVTHVSKQMNEHSLAVQKTLAEKLAHAEAEVTKFTWEQRSQMTPDERNVSQKYIRWKLEWIGSMKRMIADAKQENQKALADAEKVQRTLRDKLALCEENVCRLTAQKLTLASEKSQLEEWKKRSAKENKKNLANILEIKKSEWTKRFALKEEETNKTIRGLIQALEQAGQRGKEGNVFQITVTREGIMKCGGCGVLENKERMRICEGCARDKGVEEKEGGKEMAPFVLCGHCILDGHLGHKVAKYGERFVPNQSKESPKRGIKRKSS